MTFRKYKPISHFFTHETHNFQGTKNSVWAHFSNKLCDEQFRFDNQLF